MRSILLFALLSTLNLHAQYQLKPAGGPPPETAPAVAAMLQQSGLQLISPAGPAVLELWVTTTIPNAAAVSEDSVTLPTIPHGALLGIIRFPAAASDRRGLPIKPGLYTLRFSYYPTDGNHQGAAPQRDFLILSPVADDKEPNTRPNFNTLMELSRKASGTAHPLCLSFWKGDAVAKPELEHAGNDWILKTKIGETPVAIIVIGKFEG